MKIHIGWLSDTAEPPAILAAVAGGDIAISHGQNILRNAKLYDLLCGDKYYETLPELCHARRVNDGTPLIILGPMDSRERCEWIQAGADDALHIGWGTEELAARIKAAVHKARLARGLWNCGPLSFSLLERNVRCQGKPVAFNTREYALLLYLARAKGKTVSREELFKNIWGLDFDPGTNRIEVYIFRLRRKLRRHKASRMIQTVKGTGYRMRAT